MINIRRMMLPKKSPTVINIIVNDPDIETYIIKLLKETQNGYTRYSKIEETKIVD